MFDRENVVGLLLLGLCLAAGGIMLFSILTGTQLRYTGPGWVAVVLAVGFVGATLYALFTSRGRWRNPFAGGGRRWRRGRKDDDGR